jgi:tetratricopeptide (TPR) repeat protein
MRVAALTLLAALVAGCASDARFLWEEYMASGMDAVRAKHYDTARALFARASRKAEELGPEEMGRSLNGLGEVYRLQGRPRDAERALLRALAIKETGLGPDHPEVAITLTNLALVYTAEGRDTDAAPLLERSLAIQEKAPAPNQHALERTVTLLAEVYHRLGRDEAARPLDERARTLRETPPRER